LKLHDLLATAGQLKDNHMKHIKLFCLLSFVVLLLSYTNSEAVNYTYASTERMIGAVLSYCDSRTYAYDASNRLIRIFPTDSVAKGDINNDGAIKLDDAILTLQLLSGLTPIVPVFKASDIDNNNKIDSVETIWILRNIAGF